MVTLLHPPHGRKSFVDEIPERGRSIGIERRIEIPVNTDDRPIWPGEANPVPRAAEDDDAFVNEWCEVEPRRLPPLRDWRTAWAFLAGCLFALSVFGLVLALRSAS